MLIAELIAPREMRLAEQEIQEPGPGEVQVRVKAVGICGSDLHYYFDGGFGAVRLKEPMILGHEIAGTVARVGAAGQAVVLLAHTPPQLVRLGAPAVRAIQHGRLGGLGIGVIRALVHGSLFPS